MVSIIIPCYNAEKHIKETIRSVLEQSHHDFELLLVDDGSTDKSKIFIKSINDKRIKYYYKTNEGVSLARNFGLLRAKRDYILFLDSDDILHPNFLESRVFNLDKSTAIACASNVVLVDKKGDEIEENKKHFAADKSSQILEFSDGIVTCPSSYVYKTSFLKSFNLTFNKKLQSSADKYFLLEVLKQGEIELINKSPMYYRVLNNSMSHKITKTLLKDQIAFYNEVKKFLENNNSVTNSYYGRLGFTIAASAFYSKEYFIFIKYLCKSFFLSPKTMISLLIK